MADPYDRKRNRKFGAWHETALTPQVDFVHFVYELHQKITSAGQTIGKPHSHAVTQKMLASHVTYKPIAASPTKCPELLTHPNLTH